MGSVLAVVAIFFYQSFSLFPHVSLKLKACHAVQLPISVSGERAVNVPANKYAAMGDNELPGSGLFQVVIRLQPEQHKYVGIPICQKRYEFFGFIDDNIPLIVLDFLSPEVAELFQAKLIIYWRHTDRHDVFVVHAVRIG